MIVNCYLYSYTYKYYIVNILCILSTSRFRKRAAPVSSAFMSLLFCFLLFCVVLVYLLFYVFVCFVCLFNCLLFVVVVFVLFFCV